ncbi:MULTISPECIES: DUF5339 domain-containing protein [unclassified Gilliamella]|uniref:DUF5339 domain-containing protein n=1 Tax=unclassified Gilliamella TaxID=2685620 RepID=UPI00130986B0|nr:MULTISPECIES: DUF5339 domain-containing protein [unclassified Gilliamella]MWP49997.1 TonB-dependent receptor [Gilliamella sp. Lep-s35]MWP69712.1 TonB-dependent receptor [Gilliamella sp. Lep-s5]MWP78023.1 TonB-dependent receptor [Gilliamella sp. Lep-s21]
MKKLILSIVLLGLSSVAMADLSQSCKTYFNKIDNLIKLVPQNEASEQQIDSLKQQLELQKKQFSLMSIEMQESSCKKGIELYTQIERLVFKK